MRVTRDAEAQTAYDVRRALYQWAHAEAERRPGDDAPSARAWGAVLGVGVGVFLVVVNLLGPIGVAPFIYFQF